MQLLEPTFLQGLWGAAAAAGLGAMALLGRRARIERWLGATLGAPALRRAGVSGVRSFVKGAMLVAALALTSLALARPAWNPTPKPVQRSGRDVVFVVDVSKSMLATDIAPSRLGRAKLAIGDVLDAARGDRFGVIAFAGSAVVKCPLTTDYGFVRLAVQDLSPDSVSRGGTLIGDAIRAAMTDLFKTDDESSPDDRFRDIILITDGEDQESFPMDAAAAAGKRGIRIIALGLGSQSGSAVPTRDESGRTREMTYEGTPVRSRMDPDALAKIAAASAGGVFLNVGTGNIELDRVYKRLAETSERRSFGDESAMRYTEGFQLFLAGALALAMMECLIRESKRR